MKYNTIYWFQYFTKFIKCNYFCIILLKINKYNDSRQNVQYDIFVFNLQNAKLQLQDKSCVN